MKTETFDFAGYSGTILPANLWMPEGEVKAVLQVTHGMTEHMGRYEAFAAYLCTMGIAVAGFDLRGHGRNPGDAEVASFGEGGWAASIEDMQLFYELMEQRLPGVPHYMLGFSLGSFLLREYLTKCPDVDGIAGAIIMGTGHQPGWLLTIMRWIVKGQIKKVGFDKTTDLVRQLSFGAYNQKFKPNRTAADWLCADEAERLPTPAEPAGSGQRGSGPQTRTAVPPGAGSPSPGSAGQCPPRFRPGVRRRERPQQLCEYWGVWMGRPVGCLPLGGTGCVLWVCVWGRGFC